MAEHSLGQIVAYLTVCEILADASTGADGVLWCERSGFYRRGFATLGATQAKTFSASLINPSRVIFLTKGLAFSIATLAAFGE